MNQKTFDFLFKHKEKKIIYVSVRIVVPIIDYIQDIKDYFKKDVKLYVNYMNDEDGRYPYTINGFICRKGVAHSLGEIPYDQLDDTVSSLKEEDAPIQFELYTGGFKQITYLPKWARKLLAEKLIEIKQEHAD